MMIASDQQASAHAPTVETNDPETPGRDPLTKDQIFHLLQNERRRLALQYLRGKEGKVKMRDIAEQVAAWEHDTTVQALSSDERQRVYIPLYQNHLPKLDEEGVIEYNQSRGIVERTPAADELDPYIVDDESTTETPAPLDQDAASATPWPTYYLATSLFSTVLLGAAAFGTPIVSGISTMLLGLLVVAAFTTLTLAQFFSPAARSASR